jgi:penicillin-binding protein 1A
MGSPQPPTGFVTATIPKPHDPRWSRWRRRLAWTLAGALAAVLLGIVSVLATIAWYGRGAAEVDPRSLLDYRPTLVTRVLARDGTLIGELHTGERRTLVSDAGLPPRLVDAFLAAEDADFFTHEGLDWPSIGRAIAANFTRGEVHQGASTITQQVIKNTLLAHERGITRKSEELLLAGRVEATLDKRQIFTIYVNQIYFGEGRYGVVEAARDCFAKSLAELDLGEMATLAALPNAPGVVTCRRRTGRLAARRDYVLAQMVEHGFARSDEIAGCLGQPIVAVAPEIGREALGEADEFVELARLELIRRYGPDALERLGATVRTSVDLEVQRAARAGGRRELDLLEARHGYGGHARPLAPQARQRLEARAPAELEIGDRRMVVIAETGPIRAGERIRASLATHALEIELGSLAQLDEAAIAQRFGAGHGLSVQIRARASADRPALAELVPGPELALVLAEVASGDLLAVLGGREFRRGEFDRARLGHRQPGSSFKPVVFAAALRSGQFTPDSTLPSPDQGRAIDLREALAQSDNAVALALFDAIGPGPIHALARDLGIRSSLSAQRSLALGTSELSPLELLTAYLTLARGGDGIEPRAILEIEVPARLDGTRPERIDDAQASPRRFGVAPELATAMTELLTHVITYGTGKPAQALDRPVAGKTGTTDEARDAWFAGFTANHVAVTWVGFDIPASLGRDESGSSLALAIWLAALERASAGHPIAPLASADARAPERVSDRP